MPLVLLGSLATVVALSGLSIAAFALNAVAGLLCWSLCGLVPLIIGIAHAVRGHSRAALYWLGVGVGMALAAVVGVALFVTVLSHANV
ncbi:MAG: hypothetical protein KGN02_08385 [bacterium]|nr:hypothetical protein [bacterium]